MDIRSGLDGLKSILGVSQPAGAAAGNVRRGGGADAAGLASDEVTFSSAGNQVAQSASSGEVRMDKVAQVQAALAEGTYSVPASAVAASMVDAMLGTR